MKTTLRIYRYDSDKNKSPNYSDFKIKVDKGMTILDGLRKIKDDLDGSLSYRCSCRSGICGSCAMVINNNSKLACNTQIEDEVKTHGKLIVEPMKNMAVQKDLVVDMQPFWDHMKKLKPWLITDEKHVMPEKEHIMKTDEVNEFKGTPNCISCGACHSSCPAVMVDPDFPGPAALAKLYRFTVDPRDDAKQERLKSISTDGLWWCVRCYECVKACPKEVRPGEVITDLKEIAVKNKHKSDIGAKHAIEFLDNIRKHGMLNEEELILKTLKLGAVKKLKLGTKMILKGKYKPLPLLGETIDELDEIETMYKELKKDE